VEHKIRAREIRRKHLRKRIRTAPRKAYKNKMVRYIFSGGTATGVDVGSYWLFYNFILDKSDLDFGFMMITAPIAALIISYTLGLITNFLITKYFVFSESNTRGREQFVRYLLIAAIIFVGNYFLMKILVEVIKIWPTIARIISAGTIAFMSYRLHKVFTFKVKL
jgi:putative flippase GtrA